MRADDQNSGHKVQVGGFDKPAEAAVGGPPAHSTNSQPADATGLQQGQRPECTKNITLGSLRNEKLFLGTPGWGEKWIEKNQKRMTNICFSATPMHGVTNYLIVFYPAPGNSDEQADVNPAMPIADASVLGGVGAFTTKYGSTWHYVAGPNVGVPVLTRNDAAEPHSQSHVWYATAYAEDGSPVAERWPEAKRKENAEDTPDQSERASEELLGRIVEDLRSL
jgi:hypothetical protein